MKCNTTQRLHEHLMRRSEAEALSGPMIQSFHGEADVLRSDGIEVAFLGEVLAHQPIGVLVGAALPGRVGVREVEGGIELAGDGLVVGEFLAVVRRQGMHARLEGFEQARNRLANEMGGFTLDLGQQGIAALALDQADEGLAMIGADDRVALPMAYASARLDRGRTGLN